MIIYISHIHSTCATKHFLNPSTAYLPVASSDFSSSIITIAFFIISTLFLKFDFTSFNLVYTNFNFSLFDPVLGILKSVSFFSFFFLDDVTFFFDPVEDILRFDADVVAPFFPVPFLPVPFLPVPFDAVVAPFFPVPFFADALPSAFFFFFFFFFFGFNCSASSFATTSDSGAAGNDSESFDSSFASSFFSFFDGGLGNF